MACAHAVPNVMRQIALSLNETALQCACNVVDDAVCANFEASRNFVITLSVCVCVYEANGAGPSLCPHYDMLFVYVVVVVVPLCG